MLSRFFYGWAVLVLVLGAAAPGHAVVTTDSWIFRSGVAGGQSMWGPGTSGLNHKYSDGLQVQSGMLKGTGVSYELQADTGTVSGNVEGRISANYNRQVSSPGKTKISLAYNGIEGESKIATDFGAKLAGTANLKVDFPWWAHLIPPFPNDIDISIPVGMVNADLNIDNDFTTGLGNTVSVVENKDLLAPGFDVAFIQFALELGLKQSLWFTPETITGIVRYTHMESMTQRTMDLAFTGLTGGSLLDLELDLDLPGHWEISLEDFSVGKNRFSQDLDLYAALALGIPILTMEAKYETTLFDAFDLFQSSEFELDFLAHGDDGDETTIDRLGRFNIYVSHAPVPGAVWLLGSGLLALAGLGRRRG
ncbi:MAG: hypothetical protein HUN04_03465 [Desulfobacter sp.]|nr:MAG: hypothetical protein HUN04_03465 [Desulfobacter sp.]